MVALIAGHGLVAFRDPCGIRPLVLGRNDGEYMLALPESVALDCSGFALVRDVAPGERCTSPSPAGCTAANALEQSKLAPCLFEYVYFARQFRSSTAPRCTPPD